MEENRNVFKHQAQESFLVCEEQTAEESVKKKVEVEERAVMPTKVVPKEIFKEITSYVLRNPNPKLITKLSYFHLRFSFSPFYLTNEFFSHPTMGISPDHSHPSLGGLYGLLIF